MGNTCEYCGSHLSNGAKFCSNCGAPVEHTSKKPYASNHTDRIIPDPVLSYVGTTEGKPPEIPIYEPDTDLQSMFLRHDNRLNRQRFILRSFGHFIIVTVVAGVLFTIAEALQSTLIYLLAIVASLIFMIPGFMLVIRRLHDLDRPGWWCIGTMIPGINIIFAIYLMFFVGTNGPNQYGPDPLYEV